MRLGIALVAIAATFVAACTPSINPAAKADVDARIAKLRAQPVTIPAPTADETESMPPAVGQWAEYKMIQHNGEPKFLTQKIVGEDGGAFLVEVVHDSYQGRRVEQLLVAVGDRKDPKKVELRGVKIKSENERLTTLSKADLWVARNHMGPVDLYWDDAIGVSMAINWRGRPQASTTVIAGRFEGCYHGHSPPPLGLEVWSHPAVPFGGLVRQQDDQRGFVSELVAYGTTGAQSDL